MFYLHFLALPMFLSLLPDLAAQMHELNMSSQRAEVQIPIPKVSVNLTRTSIFTVPELPIHILPYQEGTSLLSIVRTQNEDTNSPILLSFSIPHVYLPLIVNTITQLLCVAGVHRLTTRVSAVTVTLVLVVRKAFSLIISVVGIVHLGRTFRDWVYFGLDRAIVSFGWDKEIKTEEWAFQLTGLERFLTTLGTALTGIGAKKPQVVDKTMMWLGAMMVMLGTFGYTLGSRAKAATRKEKAE
jgi:UDP-xylose/UDP-N-acetylglucosamine transporter B4